MANGSNLFSLQKHAAAAAAALTTPNVNKAAVEGENGPMDSNKLVVILGRNRVARFFFVQYTKTGKYLPNGPQNIPNGHNIPMHIKWP
jgi:hypothetical protein